MPPSLLSTAGFELSANTRQHERLRSAREEIEALADELLRIADDPSLEWSVAGARVEELKRRIDSIEYI